MKQRYNTSAIFADNGAGASTDDTFEASFERYAKELKFKEEGELDEDF